MPDPGQFALFVAAALLLAVTPGPGIFYVAARTLAGGRSEGTASVLLNTGADVVVAYAAGGVRAGIAGRPGLIRRLREASGAAMVALGLGLLLARRPATAG
jgi:threonine/homoserine/homoserine lactone efflux protein